MKKVVYFMKPKGKKGPIKIGCSNGPDQRLETLAAWSPYPLEIVGTVPGNFPDEGFLHSCLADHHLHREWFKAVPQVIEAMQKVLAAGSVEAVRAEMEPAGSIRKKIRRKRTEDEKQRFSYSKRVSLCENKTRKVQADRWRAPDEVHRTLDRWGGYRYWDAALKEYVRVPPTPPSAEQLAQLNLYLSEPLALSVVPAWQRRTKDPICIPHVDVEAPAAETVAPKPTAVGAIHSGRPS